MEAETLHRPYYLLTVFTKSNWMDPLKRKKFRSVKNQVAITNLRKNEDRRFAKSLHLIPLFLKFEDCLLRDGEVFYQPNKKLEADLVEQVAISIRFLIKKYKPRNIVVPFPSGVKQHYDHRIVFEAARLVASVLCNPYFVDDMPYGRITNPNKHNLKLFTKSKISSMREKFRIMEIYESQMCDLFFNQVRKITEQNQGCERIFILRDNK